MPESLFLSVWSQLHDWSPEFLSCLSLNSFSPSPSCPLTHQALILALVLYSTFSAPNTKLGIMKTRQCVPSHGLHLKKVLSLVNQWFTYWPTWFLLSNNSKGQPCSLISLTIPTLILILPSPWISPFWLLLCIFSWFYPLALFLSLFSSACTMGKDVPRPTVNA